MPPSLNRHCTRWALTICQPAWTDWHAISSHFTQSCLSAKRHTVSSPHHTPLYQPSATLSPAHITLLFVSQVPHHLQPTSHTLFISQAPNCLQPTSHSSLSAKRHTISSHFIHSLSAKRHTSTHFLVSQAPPSYRPVSIVHHVHGSGRQPTCEVAHVHTHTKSAASAQVRIVGLCMYVWV